MPYFDVVSKAKRPSPNWRKKYRTLSNQGNYLNPKFQLGHSQQQWTWKSNWTGLVINESLGPLPTDCYWMKGRTARPAQMVIDHAYARGASKGVTSHGFDSAVRDHPPPCLCVCVTKNKWRVASLILGLHTKPPPPSKKKPKIPLLRPEKKGEAIKTLWPWLIFDFDFVGFILLEVLVERANVNA